MMKGKEERGKEWLKERKKERKERKRNKLWNETKYNKIQ